MEQPPSTCPVNKTLSNLLDGITANAGEALALCGSKSGDLQPDEKFAKRSYLGIMTSASAISDKASFDAF